MDAIAWMVTVCSCLAGASSVSGHVSGHEGGPVAGARVFMEAGLSGALVDTRAAADGAFRFDGVSSGVVGVFAIADGHAFGGRSITVALGEQVADVAIRLGVPGSVRGRVTRIDGRPIARASVSPVLLLPDAKVGIPYPKLGALGFEQALSDEDGGFTLSRLPQGATALLKVSHPLFAQQCITDVMVGDTDVRVQLDPGVGVSGEVVSRDGSLPVVNAHIVFHYGKPPNDSTVTRTDHRGRFAVRLRPGIYAYQAASAELRSPGWEELVVTGELTEQRVVLRVAGTGAVRGEVRDAHTGDPIPGAVLTLSAFGNPAARARTGPTGEYEMPAAEGENLVALGRTPGYLAPKRKAFRVTVSEGQTLAMPTFWLQALPPYFVQVFDSEMNPAPGVVVTILRPAQFGWRLTDAQGRVELRLASVPDDGKVVGMAEHRSEPLGAVFAIESQNAGGASVQLFPFSRVTGKIVTARGKPLEGAVVGAVLAADAGEPPLPVWRTVSRSDGAFAWTGVVPYVPARCVVWAGQGTSGASGVVNLKPGAARELGNLVVADGEEATSIHGMPLGWHELPVLAGSVPDAQAREGRATVLLYCEAHEAPMTVEGLAEAQKLLAADPVRFVAVVDGVYTGDARGVPVLRGKAPSAATTYVLDAAGRVVLETFGMPPLRALQQTMAPLPGGPGS